MVTKAIIEKVISDYEVKVRIPIFESAVDLSSQSDTALLNTAIICTMPRCTFVPKVGDVVIVTFEDHDPGKPIILGCLQRSNVTDMSDLIIDLSSDNSLSSVVLSQATSIGDIKPNELEALKNIDTNIQSQINSLQNTLTYMQKYVSDNFELKSNKTSDILDDPNSIVKYPNIKAVYDLVKPYIIYGSDDYTKGILGLNDKTQDISLDKFQISDVDLTKYKRIKCYIAASTDSLSVARLTPPQIVEVYLEPGQQLRGASIDKNHYYLGQSVGYCTEDRNVMYRCTVAVSEDKTKICFVDQSTLYGTTIGGRNDNARFLYKIEGYLI